MKRRWAMIAQGVIAAYLLGILIAGGLLDVRQWSEPAAACSISFLVGWLVRMDRAPFNIRQ